MGCASLGVLGANLPRSPNFVLSYPSNSSYLRLLYRFTSSLFSPSYVILLLCFHTGGSSTTVLKFKLLYNTRILLDNLFYLQYSKFIFLFLFAIHNFLYSGGHFFSHTVVFYAWEHSTVCHLCLPVLYWGNQVVVSFIF